MPMTKSCLFFVKLLEREAPKTPWLKGSIIYYHSIVLFL